jgi:hypothetical protein
MLGNPRSKRVLFTLRSVELNLAELLCGTLNSSREKGIENSVVAVVCKLLLGGTQGIIVQK